VGYDSKERWIQILQAGDLVISGLTGEPISLGQVGPWSSGFSDTVRANFAAEGLANVIKNTLSDPQKNHVDFLRPVYPTIKSPDHFIETGVAATFQSGSRALHIKNVTAPTDRDFRGPLLRIPANRTYRLTARWKSSGSDASLITFGLDEYDADFATTAGNFTGLLTGTGGSWQFDGIVFTTHADTRFGVVRLNRPGTTARGDIYVDEILLEPIGGLVRRHTDAGQSIATTTNTTVAFEDTSEANDTSHVTYSAGIFTCVRPGDYDIMTTITFNAIGSGVAYSVAVFKNGAVVVRGGTDEGSASPSRAGASVSVNLRLSRGDTIEIKAYHEHGSNRSLISERERNWVVIKRQNSA